MNRIRTIGRLVFSFALLSVGFSAMTESKSLIMNKYVIPYQAGTLAS
jgi:hypothetical protein